MAGADTNVVSLPMTAADDVHGSLTTYIDFESPMGTNIYEPVGLTKVVSTCKHGRFLELPNSTLSS